MKTYAIAAVAACETEKVKNLINSLVIKHPDMTVTIAESSADMIVTELIELEDTTD